MTYLQTVFRNMQQDREILIEPTQGTLRTVFLRPRVIGVIVGIVVGGIVAAIVTTSHHHSNPNGGNYNQEQEQLSICNDKPKDTWAQSMCKDSAFTRKPCTDFEQYACGGWEQLTTVPDGLYSWDRFMDTGRKIFQKIRESFDSGKTVGTAERKAKQFFDQCMKQTRRKRTKTLDNFRHILTHIKGSHSLKYSSTRDNSLLKILLMVHQYDVWPLFKVYSRVHPDDPTKQILTIGPGESPFHESITKESETILKLTTPKQSHVMDSWLSKRKLLSPEEDIASSGVQKMLNLQEAEDMLILKSIWQMSDVSNCGIYEYIDEPCPYQSEVKRAAVKLLNLQIEIKLALLKGRNSSSDRYVKKIPNKVIRWDYLMSRCNSIDWKQYLQILATGKVNSSTEILLVDEEAVLEVCKVFTNYTVTYDKRKVLANYLLLSWAKTYLKYFDTALIVDDKDYDYDMQQDYTTNHWYRCMIWTNDAFGMATGSTYIRTLNSADEMKTLNNIETIVSYVKKAYKKHILSGSWLDSVTRKRAEEKIDLMVDKIGYPVTMMNATYRDKLYSSLKIYSDWLSSLAMWKKLSVKHLVDGLWKPIDRNRWVLTPATVNAEHDMLNNDINIPISLFQLPFYSSDRPMVMNFGAFGSVIAHEITHAFGKRGSFYDEYGRMHDWLSNHAEKYLTQKSECIKHKYANFMIQGYKANPNLTIDEDISDTVGIRVAYYAYQLWAQDNNENFDKETRSWMKKYSLTVDKLFFLAFSQNFCEKFTQDGLKKLAGSHSPGPFRIKGSLSDTDFFQKAFSCPSYSPYVSMKRCRIW